MKGVEGIAQILARKAQRGFGRVSGNAQATAGTYVHIDSLHYTGVIARRRSHEVFVFLGEGASKAVAPEAPIEKSLAPRPLDAQPA